MNMSYKRALEMEVNREWYWRKTAQGAFEASMVSLDALVESFDMPDDIAAFSDGGAAVERMNAADDERERERKIAAALSRLSSKEREFAEAVLGGKTWRDLGYTSRQGLNQRLDTIIAKITKSKKR